MNMNNIFTKLRKQNSGNYRQLLFCFTFAVLMVTSFASTMFSPTIQNSLEDGGDSRKLVGMIFIVALIGCLMFSVYTVGLFLKYKSRETGVFLALGTPKKIISKALYTEFVKMLLPCAAIGVLGGVLLSFAIWQLFSLVFMNNKQLKYQFSVNGVVAGLLFAVVVLILTLALAVQFMKRSNIMDILNDERKSETSKPITKGYGVSGVVLLVSGLILGYGVPSIMGNVFHFLMPTIWNATYLLVPVGMYRLIAYAISYNKRGKNPQKYYKKLISSSMMKFQGKQTVRNMLVIALLVAASLFALSYVPMMGFANLWLNTANPTDFALNYKLSMDEVTKEDIFALAQEHEVDITSYDELIFAELVGSGVDRNFSENGILVEDYQEKYLLSEFISETAYNKAHPQQQANGASAPDMSSSALNDGAPDPLKRNNAVSVPEGKYIILRLPEAAESIWQSSDDLDLATNLNTGESINLSLLDILETQSLARAESQRYIINDNDYAKITKGISLEHQTKQIIFNVRDVEASYSFGKALFQLYLEKAPPELARMLLYDGYQHSLAIEEGKEYSYAKPIELTMDNPELFSNWKYYPPMKIVIEKTLFQGFAVKFLLFIYVAVICLCAVAIIAYTRSISVGLSNKRLFADLGKLGANNKYLSKIIISQLRKIFIIPTIIGSVLILVFGLFISFGNDGQFTINELKVFGVNLFITLIVWVCLFIVYNFALKKTKKIVGIK